MRKGRVCLVGAGPGDPKLLTIRAWEALRTADVVVYDNLVSSEILGLIPGNVRRVPLGNSGKKKERSQEEINALLVSEARNGHHVVRLKGGDPFLFGRGGEEAQALRANDVDFEVVPGVSSALAVPAYAGIPLTHRKYSSSVAIVTGHEDPFKPRPSIDWERLATTVDTIVVLMGSATYGKIAKELVRGGLSKDTALAAIEWGTTRRQRTFLSTLGDIDGGKSLPVQSPCIIVVGRVAGLASELSWFLRDQLYLYADSSPVLEVVSDHGKRSRQF